MKELFKMKWPFARSTVVAVASPAAGDLPGANTNLIGARTFVKGDLKGEGFRIEGTVDGLIDSDGPLYIGEGGVVNGCIRATNLVILGRVEGDVEASGHLEVGPNGRIIGDISVQSFHMHKGGIFRGVSRMLDEGGSAHDDTAAGEGPEHGEGPAELPAPSRVVSHRPRTTTAPRELTRGAQVSEERLLAGSHDDEGDVPLSEAPQALRHAD